MVFDHGVCVMQEMTVETKLEPYVLPYDPSENRLMAFLEPLLFEEGFELVHLVVVPQKTGPVVRMFVGTLGEGFIKVGQLSFLNGYVRDVLSAKEELNTFLGKDFGLEISSPGLDRPLSKKSHFEAALNGKIKTRGDGAVAPKSAVGTLQEVGDDGILLLLKGDETAIKMPFASLTSAHFIYEFENTSKTKKTGRKK